MELTAQSLIDAIKAAAGRLPRDAKDNSPHRLEPSLPQSVKSAANRKRNPPTTRAGRKGILIYFDQHVAAAIRRLASDCNATNQESLANFK
jgi:hypothetical protein